MFKTTTNYYFFVSEYPDLVSRIEAGITALVTDGKTDGTHTITDGPHAIDLSRTLWPTPTLQPWAPQSATRTWTDIESANAWKTIVDTILTEYEATNTEIQDLRTKILASIGADLWTTTVEEIITT
jgi:hypothetical protein